MKHHLTLFFCKSVSELSSAPAQMQRKNTKRSCNGKATGKNGQKEVFWGVGKR